MMKKGDIILAAVLLLLCVGLMVLSLLPGSDAGYASVCVDGEEVARIDLDEDSSCTVQNEYGINVIAVSGGKVSVQFADCPDEICTGFAPISRSGECIVCLPHRLSVRIIAGDSPPEVDSVTK